MSGDLVLNKENSSSNRWIARGAFINHTRDDYYQVTGIKSLSGTLDRVRVTAIASGGEEFDNGEVNIQYS